MSCTPYPVFACLIVLASVWNQTTPAAAQDQQFSITVRTQEEMVRAAQNAIPGTTIIIEPGKYRGGLSFTGLTGTKNKPIVIAGADENDPPVFEGGGSGLHLRSPSHVELRHLVFTGARGNGINIDDGGNADGSAHDLYLFNLQIHDIGPRGNRDGLKLSGVDRFVVDGCSFERWGDGGSAIDMVGCHEGQIKNSKFKYRSDIEGNGVQTKGGSSKITVALCHFENAGSRAVNIGGSTGREFFRPKTADYEAKEITVEDCTFTGSMAPIAFVGVDGATVRYNTIYRPTRWVFRILQENQGADFVPCRNGSFTNNLIAYRTDEVKYVVNVGEKTASETFQFTKNHWFCIDNPASSNRVRLPADETAGSYGRDPQFADVEKLDLQLKETSPVRDAGVRPKRD